MTNEAFSSIQERRQFLDSQNQNKTLQALTFQFSKNFYYESGLGRLKIINFWDHATTNIEVISNGTTQFNSALSSFLCVNVPVYYGLIKIFSNSFPYEISLTDNDLLQLFPLDYTFFHEKDLSPTQIAQIPTKDRDHPFKISNLEPFQSIVM